MEVVTYNKHNQDLTLFSDKHRVFLKLIEEMFGRVVKKMAVEVVKEQTDYLVTRYFKYFKLILISILNKRMQDRPQAEKDPMKLMTLQFIERFIEKEVFVVAKEGIREQSDDYFKDLQYSKLMKDILIPNTVRHVVFEAIDDIILENYLENTVNNLIKELASKI